MKTLILCLVLCFALLSSALADPNMLVCYEFAELGAGVGDTTADTGEAPAADGTLAGLAAIVADAGGDVGPKAASNVLDQGYVDCGTVPKLANLGSFTAAAWIKLSGGYWDCIIDGSGTNTWFLHIPGTVRFEAPGNFSMYSNTIVNDGKWHHVVGVRDVDSAKAKLYIDGVLEVEAASATALMDAQNLRIGAPVGGNNFGGEIDSVKIFGGALTAEEIVALYAEGLPAPSAVPGAASNPDPQNGEVAVPVNGASISWDVGADSQWSRVYFGTAPIPADVNGAVVAADPNLSLFITMDTTVNLGTLDALTPYYWRVDELNTLGLTAGPPWSFTTGYQPGSSSDPNLIYYANFDDVGLAAGDIINDYGDFPWQDAPLLGNSVTVFDATRGSGVMDVAKPGGLDLGPAGDLGMGGSYTVAMWFNHSGGIYYDYLFALNAPGSHYDSRMYLRLDSATSLAVSHPYIASHSVIGDWSGTGWHHVAVVFDDTANTLTMYVDNVAQTPVACDRLDPVAGYNAFVGRSDSGLDFGGMIDDVAIYSVPLSASEISDIYTNGVAAGYASGHAPADKEIVVASAVTSLDWVNAGGAEGVNVMWYGDSLTNTPVNLTSGAFVDTAAFPEPLAYPNTYYWRVDTIVGGVSQAGRLVSFEVGNFAPVADAGTDQEVYLTGGFVDVTLDGSGTSDDGQPGPYTVTWSEISGPGTPAVIDPVDAEITTATITEAGTYVFELLVDDGEKTDTDEVTVVVYVDSCAHAAAQPGFVWNPGDTDYDCDVDMTDLANVAAGWLDCYASGCP